MKVALNGFLTSIFWIILGTLIFFRIYQVYSGFSFKVSFETPSTKNNSIKSILYWLPMWNNKTFYFQGTGVEPFKSCQIKTCYVTHDRNLIPIEKFDAIIFHAPEFFMFEDDPSSRNPNQKYVFASLEAPTAEFTKTLDSFDNFYNWTMTYRADSDIVWPYGHIIKNKINYNPPSPEFIQNKTGQAIWLVSHCVTSSKREVLATNLQKYIRIDIYGKCGLQLNKTTEEIKIFIEENYKFYISFENSYCKDYASEKLYNGLRLNVIPVVYGGADYEKIAPPKSVIIADKFRSVKHLADYLLFLDNNTEEYLKYFEWKKNYVETDNTNTACQLCQKLHDPAESVKVYKNIKLWWTGRQQSFCKYLSPFTDFFSN